MLAGSSVPVGQTYVRDEPPYESVSRPAWASRCSIVNVTAIVLPLTCEKGVPTHVATKKLRD